MSRMPDYVRTPDSMEELQTEIERLNHIIDTIVQYGIPDQLYEGSHEQKLRNEIESLKNANNE